MLLAILLILLQTGTTDLQILLTTEFSERRQILLWIAFFASFAVKVPKSVAAFLFLCCQIYSTASEFYGYYASS